MAVRLNLGLTYPTAETVARALLFAAGRLGERRHFEWAPRSTLAGAGRSTRAAWHVLAALDAAYPRIGLTRMARWCGIRDEELVFSVELGRRRRRADWDAALELALFKMVAPS